jgi:hypothetical protein
MRSMNLQRAMLGPAVLLLVLANAPDILAGPGGAQSAHSGHGAAAQHHGNSAGGHSGSRYIAPYRARYPYAISSSYWGVPSAYGRAAYYAPAYAPTYAPARAAPALYYVPPLSPDAPPFSFDGSPAVQLDWGWQRVSLRQLVAEVQAKREAGRRP